MTRKTKQYRLWAGLLLCSAVVTSANTLVTFQVDMSTASFDPSSQTVSAHGDFNAWGAGIALTNNPSGANPSLWTGTANVAANGTVMQYKYVIDPAGAWESIPKGNNRLAILPATSGASLVLPLVYYADIPPAQISVNVTFQVDMAMQISIGAFDPNSSTVYPKGTFNGWGTFDAMINDPTILRTNQNGLVTSNVYVNTYSVPGSPGETMDYKFYIDTGNTYESPAAGTGDPSDNNNRFFNLSTGPTQVLPLVFFSDVPYAPVATNNVTFQVDMTAQVLAGNFDPTTGTVEVRGDFNGWGTPQILCTNNPGALNTNIYKAVVQIVNGLGVSEGYKFWASISLNSGWETMADNRSLTLVSGTSQVLPVVFFSNVDPADLLPEDTLVTFTINMTNAVGTDSHVFDPSTDLVYLNGDFLNWTWPATVQLTNNPLGSELYQIGVLIPKGNPVPLTYKYSINGTDNEAASGQNHVRYVRTAGTYTLPLDTFGNQYGEPSFGELAAGEPSSGRVPVSWLGRPGVHLQTKADLSSGLWQDLLNTDGASWSNGYASTNGFISVTNYPTSVGKTFFRLIKQ